MISRAVSFAWLVFIETIKRTGVPLALISSSLILLVLRNIPVFFAAQFTLFSLVLHTLVLFISPGAPNVRHILRCILLRIEHDRPRTPDEHYFWLGHGTALYVYVTTVMLCNDRKAGVSAIKYFILLVAIIGHPLLIALVRTLLVLLLPENLGQHFAAKLPNSDEGAGELDNDLPGASSSNIFQRLYDAVSSVLTVASRILNLPQPFVKPPKRDPLYNHQDLPSSKHIRLLEIKRKLPFASVKCKLIAVPIASAPPYDCISYTWGGGDLNHDIIVENRALPVTAKVHAIVNERASYFRTRLLWIDSVCIWQENIEEKTGQLALMRKIYQEAQRVIVWLGPKPDKYDIHQFIVGVRQFLKAGEDGAYGGVRGLLLHTTETRLQREKVSMLRMLMNPYWLRVWIIQEIALQKTVHTLYGNTWIFWEDIAEVMRGFGSMNPLAAVKSTDVLKTVEADAGQMKQIWTIFRLRKWIGEGKNVSVAKLLHLSCQSQATHTKDKVYGILGMAEDHQIVPDYSKSTTATEVFLRTARILLRRQEADHLLMLQKAGMGYEGRTANLPSWVPDWANPPEPYPLARGFVGEEAADRYHASRGMRPVAALETGTNMIKLSGLYIDTVVAVTEVLSGDLDTNKESGAAEAVYWLMTARNLAMHDPMIRRRYSYDVNACFWRTIVGDRWKTMRPLLTPVVRSCDAWKNKIIQIGDLADEVQGYDFGTDIRDDPRENFPPNFDLSWLYPPADRFSYAILWNIKFYMFENMMREASFRRRLAVTGNGYIALLPPGGTIGDVLYVIAEAETPFALRKDRDTGVYQLVGEAYVHGVMDGERVAQGDVPEELLVR